MAEEVFRNVDKKIEGMSHAIAAQSIDQMIWTFDGKTNTFCERIKGIDKYT